LDLITDGVKDADRLTGLVCGIPGGCFRKRDDRRVVAIDKYGGPQINIKILSRG
jgi:hypothetical protein